jgi:predicted nucleic acid-binding protein
MSERYYFDTCIWRDHYENRFGLGGRPLGGYATKLFIKILRKKDNLFFSEFIIRELKSDYKEEEIIKMLNILFVSGVLKRVELTEKDYKEAKSIGTMRNLPHGDVLHAILARKSRAILVSQDKHLQRLRDIVNVKRPEEII